VIARPLCVLQVDSRARTLSVRPQTGRSSACASCSRSMLATYIDARRWYKLSSRTGRVGEEVSPRGANVASHRRRWIPGSGSETSP
jgi:hypothetical protein